MGCKTSTERPDKFEAREMVVSENDFLYALKNATIGNGEKLAYREVGSNKKPTLLLVHGDMSSSASFSLVVPALAKNYHIVAVDLRGFGNSTYNNKVSTLKDFADDLASFCQELKLEKVNVLGWSLGGGIVMQMAADYPGLVQSLILAGPLTDTGAPLHKFDADGNPTTERVTDPTEVPDHPIVASITKMTGEKDREALTASSTKYVFSGSRQPEHSRKLAFADYAIQQVNYVDVQWAMNVFNISHENNVLADGTGEVDKIVCPTLILSGDKDFFLSRARAEELCSTIGENAEIKIFEDCGHSVFDDEKEQTESLIHDFLQRSLKEEQVELKKEEEEGDNKNEKETDEAPQEKKESQGEEEDSSKGDAVTTNDEKEGDAQEKNVDEAVEKSEATETDKDAEKMNQGAQPENETKRPKEDEEIDTKNEAHGEGEVKKVETEATA